MSVSRVQKSEVASANSRQKGLDIRPVVGGGSCIPLDADMGTRSTGGSYGLLVLVHRGEKGVAVVTCLRRRCRHCTIAAHQRLKVSPCGSAAFRSRRHSWPDQRCRLTACRIDGMPMQHPHTWPWTRSSHCPLDGIDHLAVFACSKAEQPVRCHRTGSTPVARPSALSTTVTCASDAAQ